MAPAIPRQLPGVVAELRKLVNSGTPVMGICLGHQLLGLAAAPPPAACRMATTAAITPCATCATGQVTITTQNHEFQVVADTIPAASGFEVSHVNLNDGSVEGLRHRELPVFASSTTPKAAPARRTASACSTIS